MKPRAAALISGGLDSMLAAKVVLDQGVHVEGVNFYTGFCIEGHTQSIRSSKSTGNRRNNALWVADQLGIKLHIIDVSEEYKDVVINPRHGYGKNLNPCIDCKIFMLNKTSMLKTAGELDFDFLITGEVIGQRPKSQTRYAMPLVARESGIEDRLLRPLSAKHFEPTLPEREGWVDRAKLFDFHGRGRKPQMGLAEQYGFSDYAQPAGGCCFLTDEHYSRKLKDLWDSRNRRDYTLDDIVLLKVGRHIRPRANFKMIVSRDEGESNYLRGYFRKFPHIEIQSHNGPVALIEGETSEDDQQLAARIAGRYSQGRDADAVVVSIGQPNGVTHDVEVAPLRPHEVPSQWHVGR